MVFSYSRKIMFVIVAANLLLATLSGIARAQRVPHKVRWIRPLNERSSPVWGIHNGIVVGLWPAPVEKTSPAGNGGPRGLLRIGYEYKGIIYLINYIAIEPVVNGDMEFSEVTRSSLDDKLGKYFWAAAGLDPGKYSPFANTGGVVTHPDKKHPATEQLSLYVYMEKFINGAHPYLKLTIRSDNPGEVGIEIFNHKNSAVMQRCALTATMGNYSRLRLLYLRDSVIDSRIIFAGYNDIGFIEKAAYPADRMLRNKQRDYLALAEPNETLAQLSFWPQQAAYLANRGWHYRPACKLTQYWRVPSSSFDSSLQVRVNGRAKYWAGDSPDRSKYINIPGGPAFENFELRENYRPGQKFYFGLSRKTAKQVIAGF